MQALTEAAVRSSFVNTTKGGAKRLALPRDLVDSPWDDLDFLGWCDPAAPQRAYLVAETDDGPAGVALRSASGASGRPRRTMCAWCLTAHAGDGVALMTARRAGRAGQAGDSVGTYLCADLACSLYVRGIKKAGPGARMSESLSVEEQAARLRASLDAFVRRVLAG